MMDCLQAAVKERVGGGANKVVGVRCRGGGVVTALLEMSSYVPFTERTKDGDGSMEIDREEMVEAEAADVAEEEDYCLRSLDF